MERRSDLDMSGGDEAVAAGHLVRGKRVVAAHSFTLDKMEDAAIKNITFQDPNDMG